MEVLPHANHASDQQCIDRNQAHIWSTSKNKKLFTDDNMRTLE